MRLSAALRGELGKLIKDELRAGEAAAFGGMDRATQGLKGDLRGQITGAGLGKRLANTWRSKTYPADRRSLKPAGFLWSKAPEIVRAHAEGATIRARSRTYLAIPLPAAGKRGRSKITPMAWERAHGQRLRFIPRRRGGALLVAASARLTKSGIAVGRKAKSAAKYQVPVFVLVPQVVIKGKFDIGAAAEKWASRIPGLIASAWK